mgnify:FL=1
MTASPTLPLSEWQRIAQHLLQAAGLSESHAACMADSMMWAQSRDIDGHGLSRLPFYLNFIERGIINRNPQLHWTLELPSMMRLDADRAAGAVALAHVRDRLIEHARTHGLCAIWINHTTHTGAHGWFTQALAKQGFCAISMAASVPNMAYQGSRIPALSTAPLSMAIPHGEGQAMVLDMATSAVSLGRLNRARLRQETLPADWALDSQGEPTTEAAQAVLLQAMAGAKGSGLALMIEMLCSVVSGAPILSSMLGQEPAQRRHRQNAWVCAINAQALLSPEALTSDVAATVAAIKALPRRAGVPELLLPGERGERCHARALAHGLSLSPETWQDVQSSAEKFGISLNPS